MGTSTPNTWRVQVRATGIRVAAVSATAGAVIALPLIPATAAPDSAADALQGTITCTGNDPIAGSFTVNSGSSGAVTWNTVFITTADGTAAQLQPTSYDNSVSVNGVEVSSWSATKNAGPGNDTCDVEASRGSATLSGRWTGNVTRS